jgi:hypothetical protein
LKDDFKSPRTTLCGHLQSINVVPLGNIYYFEDAQKDDITIGLFGLFSPLKFSTITHTNKRQHEILTTFSQLGC